MERYRTNKETTGGKQAKRSLLFFMLALFLVTTCPIKKSISLMMFDNEGIENFGLNDQKTANENESLVFSGSASCSILDMTNSAKVDLHSPKVPLPLFPVCLAFLFLLPGFYSISLQKHGAAGYFEKFAFPAALTPIYIRNRRLII